MSEGGKAEPRVLVVAPLYHHARGGLGRQAVTQTEGLAERGLRMLVATRFMRGLPQTREPHPAVAIARLPNLDPGTHNYDRPSLRNLFLSLSFCLSLLRLILRQRQRFDLVYFYGASLPLILALPLLKALKKPVIAMPAGADQGVEAGDLKGRYFPLGRILAWLLAKVDAYVAIAPRIAEALFEDGVAVDRIHPIPVPVDAEGFRPASEAERARLRAARGFQEDDRLILFAGRLSPLKGVEDLLDAFALLAAQQPRARLLIAGDGPDRGRLEAKARALGLEDRVVFAGFVDDMVGLYWAADLFCLPSYAEGLPNAVLEAMACGLPVVASDLPGCQALVSPESGMIFPRGQPEALAGALLPLLVDPIHRTLAGQAGRHQVLQAFTIQRVLDALERLVRGVYAGAIGPEHRTRVFEGEAGCAH